MFCHSAITGAEKDQDLLVQSLLQEKEGFRERFLQLFKQIDDGSGRITLLEFENRFQDESVKALFEALLVSMGQSKVLDKGHTWRVKKGNN